MRNSVLEAEATAFCVRSAAAAAAAADAADAADAVVALASLARARCCCCCCCGLRGATDETNEIFSRFFRNASESPSKLRSRIRSSPRTRWASGHTSSVPHRETVGAPRVGLLELRPDAEPEGKMR
eukprot:908478-Rhodomonas_salina.3